MSIIEIKPPMPRRPEPELEDQSESTPEPTSAPTTASIVEADAAAEHSALLGVAGGAASVWQRLSPRAQRRVVWVARRVRRSRAGIAWLAMAVSAGGILLVLVLATVSLAQGEPGWWGTSRLQVSELAELARRVENAAITRITADHQGATAEAADWPVKLTDDEANAWLNLRLPVWLPRLTAESFEDVRDDTGAVIERLPVGGVGWPESVDEVRVAFVDGRFRIGARITGDGDARVFGATLAPEIRDDGSLWMRATSVSIGRLTLPAGLVIGPDGGRLRDHLPASLLDSAEGEAIFGKLSGESPLFEDAVIRLGDGRRVRLLSLEVASDSLVAFFRTE